MVFARVSVVADAPDPGQTMCPPDVPLTWTDSGFVLSVAKPMLHPVGNAVVAGSVTVSPAVVLKLDRILPLSPNVAA